LTIYETAIPRYYSSLLDAANGKRESEKETFYQCWTLSRARIGLHVDAYRYALCYLMSSLAARYID